MISRFGARPYCRELLGFVGKQFLAPWQELAAPKTL